LWHHKRTNIILYGEVSYARLTIQLPRLLFWFWLAEGRILKDIEIRTALARLLKQVEGINAKISAMPQVQINVSGRLLPTMMALQKISSGTATQISMITQRCRAFESKNLNELSMMSMITKHKQGKERVFSTKPSVESLGDIQRKKVAVIC
jgi:hypothetical protein